MNGSDNYQVNEVLGRISLDAVNLVFEGSEYSIDLQPSQLSFELSDKPNLFPTLVPLRH